MKTVVILEMVPGEMLGEKKEKKKFPLTCIIVPIISLTSASA